MAEELNVQNLKELRDLQDMARHTEIDIGGNTKILKVEGGWIYWKQEGRENSASMAIAGVFVPESPK